jgi:chromosome condensin MukBEF complex kleisin-like MukF subunit
MENKDSFEQLYAQFNQENICLRGNKHFDEKICTELLNAIPQSKYAEKNIIMILTLLPAGLTDLEIQQLCVRQKKWFGDFD